MKTIFSQLKKYIIVGCLTIIATLAVLLHQSNSQIAFLRESAITLQNVNEKNAFAIRLLKEEVVFCEESSNLLELKQSSTSTLYEGIKEDLERLKRSVSTTNNGNLPQPQETKQGGSGNEESINNDSPINLSSHLRLLNQAACSADGSCLPDNP